MMYSSLFDGMDHSVPQQQGCSAFSPPPPNTVLKPTPAVVTPRELFSPPSITHSLSPYTSPVRMVPMSPFVLSPPSLMPPARSLMPPARSPHQEAYLKRLHNNPIFKDLQNLLAQECLHMRVPTNLIDPSLSNSAAKQDNRDVFPRHMKLQEKFLELRCVDSLRSEGFNLESTYSGEVGQIEVSRYQALCVAGISEEHRRAVNHHHDNRRLALIQQYEVILQQIQKTHNSRKIPPSTASSTVSSKPLLTTDKGMISMAFPHKSSVQMTEQLPSASRNHDTSSVKQPDIHNSIPEVASSPECLEVDLSEENLSEGEIDTSLHTTRTTLGDSGICEDDASSCTSDGSDSNAETGKLKRNGKFSSQPSAHSVLQPLDTNMHTAIFDGGNSFQRNTDFLVEDYGNEGTSQSDTSENVTAQRRSLKRKWECDTTDENSEIEQPKISANPRGKKISAECTHILSAWYAEHIRYPYPSDLEVEQLAQQTGLLNQQVKKWMANKRVRNFNTLSITGNQHPIKFKFKGQRYADSEPDGKLTNYKQLHPQARRILSEWYDANLENPYPSDEVKCELARRTGITEQQVKSWFANKRSRANNTRRQVPNYFIKKFPEYTQHVQMVSLTRELARKSKRGDSVDSVLKSVNHS